VSHRIGQGYDVHAFSDDPDRPLVLGGVTVDGASGLVGHSDADVLSHVVADALLGAAGLGDLGDHFPDTDVGWAGADSLMLLAEVVRLATDAGWSVVNVDATVVAERPKLGALRPQMAERLSAVVGAPVSVKATTHEGLGALGRGEGIACLAVALLESV
jgi:2-C-methyl-D-erythritol 2,4-cyclodiphosphate synthase